MKKYKGSALLIVIILSIAFTAYIGSCLVTKNNFKIMYSKYNEFIQNYYNKDLQNLSSVYDYIENINK